MLVCSSLDFIIYKFKQLQVAMHVLTHLIYIFKGTLEFDSTLKTLKDEMMRDSRHHPEQSFDGMDTLEELADKEKFFNKLAVDVSGTLDFAKLNKALDEAQSDPEKR